MASQSAQSAQSMDNKESEWNIVGKPINKKLYKVQDSFKPIDENDDEYAFLDVKNYSNSNANSPSPLNSHYKTNRWSSLNSHTNSLTLRTSSPNMSDMSGMRYTNSPTPTNRNTLVNRNVSTPTQFKRIKLSWNSNYYLKDEFQMWANSVESIDTIMQIYKDNISSWEQMQVNSSDLFEEIQKQKNNIIKKLSEYHRVDILEKIIELEKHLPKSNDKFSPIQHAVWINSTDVRDISKLSFDNIVNTISILINSYGYGILASGQNTDNETVFGTLFAQNNCLPEELKLPIYNYLMAEDKVDWYIKNFQSYINTSSLNQQIKNKLLFIITKYYSNDKIIEIVLSKIITLTTQDIISNTKIIELLEIFITMPDLDDIEMGRYFNSITEMKELHNNICMRLVVLGSDYINQKIDMLLKSNMIDEPELEQQTLFSCYFAALGTIYSYGICKNSIITTILDYYLNLKQEESLYYKPIIQFIIHSGIGYPEYDLSQNENQILNEFIKLNYTTPKMKSCIVEMFKIILNTTDKDIIHLHIDKVLNK